MSKLTITEIARLSGVSIGTVSRVLNGRSGVSRETQATVLEVVKKTGFVPDGSARRLARGTQQLIGVAPFSDHSPRSPYFAYVLDAIQERLYERGFVARVLDPMLEEHRDECGGFIVPGLHLDEPRVSVLRRRRIPAVVIGRAKGAFPWVDVDNALGVRSALDHLVGLGHRRIAHMTGTLVAQTARTRFEAYQRGLEAHGLAYDPTLLLDGEFTDLGAYRALRARLEGESALPFTAVLAASDEMAVGSMHALRDLGYRVPRDVSVTGFDDLPFADYALPPLTTVHQPIREVGHVAAELLLEQFEGRAARQVILPTALTVRQSSAPLA